MAVKITTNIGTDLGITNEAYVRIADYNISKNGGGANFRIEIFQSEEQISPSPGTMYAGGGRTARNQQIGENIYVSLWRSVETEVTRTRAVAGTSGTSGTSGFQQQTEEYQETVITQELDLSAVEATNIFAFGYSELKKKLKELFGDSNVVDC
jgi:hypothetical protein